MRNWLKRIIKQIYLAACEKLRNQLKDATVQVKLEKHIHLKIISLQWILIKLSINCSGSAGTAINAFPTQPNSDILSIKNMYEKEIIS